MKHPTTTRILGLCEPYDQQALERFKALGGSTKRWDRDDVLKMADSITSLEDEYELRLGKTHNKMAQARSLLEDYWNATDDGTKVTKWGNWRGLRERYPGK